MLLTAKKKKEKKEKADENSQRDMEWKCLEKMGSPETLGVGVSHSFGNQRLTPGLPPAPGRVSLRPTGRAPNQFEIDARSFNMKLQSILTLSIVAALFCATLAQDGPVFPVRDPASTINRDQNSHIPLTDRLYFTSDSHWCGCQPRACPKLISSHPNPQPNG